ncbi:hypothetical protein DFH09DRAFT_1313511 [Mycena vulgaris]|nr:hypothetical protein DFH09DRAFT_1313511 [Mycena vulgaris]
MRKKDYCPHKPILHPSTRSSSLGTYPPLLFFSLAFVATLLSLFNPFTVLAIKLFAAQAGVDTTTLVSALVVYMSELFILVLSLVHYLRPKWLALQKLMEPKKRKHRTHILHLRLDRMSKYGFPPKCSITPSAACTCGAAFVFLFLQGAFKSFSSTFFAFFALFVSVFRGAFAFALGDESE